MQKGKRGAMFGKTKKEKTRWNTVSSSEKRKKNVYKLQQRVEKSLLDLKSSFLEPRGAKLTEQFFIWQMFELLQV